VNGCILYIGKSTMNDDIKVTKLLPEHAEEVARLHISGIHTGFISSLGIDFVTFLYEAIAESESAFGFVAQRNAEVVGFVAFTTNVNVLYKSVICRHGFKLALVLARKMFSPTTIKKVSETLIYPRRVKKMNLPLAELLSIAVAPQARAKGLATELTQVGFAECMRRRIGKIKVLVGADNTAANKLYLGCGFNLATRIESHGVMSNIYVVETAPEKESREELSVAGFKDYDIVGTDTPPAFVTYGWCRSSYAAVLSLGRRGIDVHVGDASPLAMSRFSRYCKSFTKLPDFFIEPERYFELACEALKRTGAKVLLPGHEDVGIFSRRRDELPSDVRIILPEWNNYIIAEDKFAVLELAQKTGCPAPHTREVGSLEELDDLAESTDWPVVIKTRIGNSAKGVHIAYGKKELFEKFQDFVKTFKLAQERWPIIQEFLPGEAAGVCVLYDHGQCVASFAERYLRCKEPGKFGTSTLRETFDDDQLISRSISIMDKLKWHGIAHLDFVADRNGEFKLIEINPRLWGALALAMFSGIDFPYLWYLTAIDQHKPDLLKLQNRKIKCRWVVGDCLAFAGLIKRARFLEALRLIIPEKKCYHDDFIVRDPLPLLLEIVDYFAKFVKAGGSMNPVVGNMIR
jgi:predicted ATP-grasp superfamily ATP-dependent carboligase/ribosomal protein S18 acetylase RimI-like enzyme